MKKTIKDLFIIAFPALLVIWFAFVDYYLMPVGWDIHETKYWWSDAVKLIATMMLATTWIISAIHLLFILIEGKDLL